MKQKYTVIYRGEFFTEIEAENEAEVEKKLYRDKNRWQLIGELHSDYVEIELAETRTTRTIRTYQTYGCDKECEPDSDSCISH